MILCISGSRYITDEIHVRDAIQQSPWRIGDDIIEVIHGGARGVDAAAHTLLDGLVPVQPYPADWDAHGRKAGPIRNGVMAAKADVLIAIPLKGKANRGTMDMVKQMRALGKPVFIYEVEA